MHAQLADPKARAVGMSALLALVVAAAVAAFAWPSARLEPRGLPLGVVGVAPERLAAPAGAFEVRRYPDEAAARAAIGDREIYGALVASRRGTALLTASAAGPAVAQLLEATFAPYASRVIDVVPADPDDPRGIAFTSVVLPLTLVGVVAGFLAAVLLPPAGRATALVAWAIVAGVVAVGVVQGWLGVIRGDWWLNATAVALVVLAIASLVAGTVSLLGHRGLALAAAVLVLCGNPWSAVSSAPELLPGWVALTGQLLPPGAGGTLIRSTAFFDGNGFEGPGVVLLVWGALGFAGIAAATLRDPARTPTTAGATAPG